MKTKFFLRNSLLLLIVIFSFSCGKGGSGDVVDTLLPDLKATWTNTADATDEFFFADVANPGNATSTFNGNNNFQGQQHTFSGSYTNSKINFTFNDGPRQGQKFSGTIKGNAPNATMILSTPSGSITLQQHQ